MSAVWRASRAAVRRRRLQTSVIGVVVLVSSMALVVALGLLRHHAGPFDEPALRPGTRRARHRHLRRGEVCGARLARTAHRAGRAGLGRAVPGSRGRLAAERSLPGIPDAAGLTVVGRAQPGGPVDRLDLFAGHWATGRDDRPGAAG